MSTLIITTSDGLESLLTCSIPNLEFNGFSINVNGSNFEVDTNGWHEIIIENVILYRSKYTLHFYHSDISHCTYGKSKKKG